MSKTSRSTQKVNALRLVEGDTAALPTDTFGMHRSAVGVFSKVASLTSERYIRYRICIWIAIRMSEYLNFLYVICGVLLLFGAAVFVHEFGHYWVARKLGLKVEAFAIGFGPKIFGWTKDGIEYSVRWIPAGGFVKLHK